MMQTRHLSCQPQRRRHTRAGVAAALGTSQNRPGSRLPGSAALLSFDRSVRSAVTLRLGAERKSAAHLWLLAEARTFHTPGSSAFLHRRCALRGAASQSPPSTSGASFTRRSSNRSVSMGLREHIGPLQHGPPPAATATAAAAHLPPLARRLACRPPWRQPPCR